MRKKLYPTTGASIRAAAVVYSNASKVVDAFDRGVLIRSKNGFWLAIPTAAAGKKGVGNKRITPGGWEQRTGQRLRFVFRRGQPSLLVAETRLNSKGRAVVSRSKTGRGLGDCTDLYTRSAGEAAQAVEPRRPGARGRGKVDRADPGALGRRLRLNFRSEENMGEDGFDIRGGTALPIA